MENSYYNMGLRQFMELFGDGHHSSLSDDFSIVDVRFKGHPEKFQLPVRLDAYLFTFCLGGKVKVNVNMKEFTLEKGQLMLFVPGCIGQVVDFDRERMDEIHYVMFGMSRRFLSMLDLDLNRLFSDGKMFLEIPRVILNEEETALFLRYLELARTLLQSSIGSKRMCLGSLVASIFYLADGIFNQQLTAARQSYVPQSNRADDIFKRFIRLVADYHSQERCVSFYADKLSLSPKYLSKIVKTVSGRGAPEWIDSYVVVEAKNFLKYSDMSIKEIVYRLHFSDQPTFTKFFKSHTGMTPAQFRKS